MRPCLVFAVAGGFDGGGLILFGLGLGCLLPCLVWGGGGGQQEGFPKIRNLLLMH